MILELVLVWELDREKEIEFPQVQTWVEPLFLINNINIFNSRGQFPSYLIICFIIEAIYRILCTVEISKVTYIILNVKIKMYVVFILIRNWCFEDLTFVISILINKLFLKLYELGFIFIRIIQFFKYKIP